MNEQRYKLGKTDRLKSRKAIEQLFRGGKSFSNFPFRVLWMEVTNGKANLQSGFTVSTKHFKNAVDRNRVKRLMRESYRLQKNELGKALELRQKQMALFFIFLGNELPQYDDVYKRMGAALKRLSKIANEN